jgi:hypothetical protein
MRLARLGREGYSDNNGHPHSNALRVEERCTRSLSWEGNFQVDSHQELEEQLGIPSKAEAYINFIANPAGVQKKL